MIPNKPQKTELLVGIFVLFGLVLLGGLVLKFGDFRYAFRPKYELSLTFQDAGTLTKSAPVRRGGVEIGRVTKDPTLVEGISGVHVPLVIYQEFHIGQGSVFSLKMDGIIGDTFIEVTPPPSPTGEMIKPGQNLRGREPSDISATANRVADKSLDVLEDIRGSLADLKTVFTKVSTGVLAEQNLANFSTAIVSLNTTLAKLDNTVLSAENTTALKETLQSLQASSTKLSTNLDGLGNTVASVNILVKQKLSPSLDEIGKAATTIRKAAEGLGIVANDMHAAPGLFSALLRDAKLRDDFTALISNLRRHGLVWGYKDDAEKLAPPRPAPR
jgi:phospholipid/cholesterol/gamma-HCH transport system substrate-binding protein